MIDHGLPPLERRAAAAQATLERFKDRPLRYGTDDCVRMAAHHLRLLGYRVKLPPSGSYRSVRSAMKELQARGFADLAEAMDSYEFERIPPAAALVGDVLMVPAEGPFGGALHVALGNHRSLSYHQDAVGAVVLQALEYVAAWRVEPK